MSQPNVVPFRFEDYEVRTITRDGEPWFVARDVCDILELENITWALDSLDDDERGLEILKTSGGNQSMKVISESGLYNLIFKSRKKEARRFRKWVTSEVLPTIRKTGSYSLPEKKEVNVNHTHMRGGLGENGLDIRYTLDLTKIIIKPTATGLELLERLTGIPLSDLTEHAPGNNPLDEMVSRFVDECCIVGSGHRESVFNLYNAFRGWWEFYSNDAVPPVRRFTSLIYPNFPRVKSSNYYATGLKLREEVER